MRASLPPHRNRTPGFGCGASRVLALRLPDGLHTWCSVRKRPCLNRTAATPHGAACHACIPGGISPASFRQVFSVGQPLHRRRVIRLKPVRLLTVPCGVVTRSSLISLGSVTVCRSPDKTAFIVLIRPRCPSLSSCRPPVFVIPRRSYRAVDCARCVSRY